MEHVHEILSVVTGKVAEVARGDVVVGDPIQMGEVTIVPLTRVSIGFGGGGGEGEGTQKGKKNGKHAHGGKGKGFGGGVGGGGKVRPVAVIVFTKDDVTVEPIPDRKGIFDKIMDKVPDVIDMVKDVAKKK